MVPLSCWGGASNTPSIIVEAKGYSVGVFKSEFSGYPSKRRIYVDILGRGTLVETKENFYLRRNDAP